MDGRKRGGRLIGGDFNARTGGEGGEVREEMGGGELGERNSKDSKINKEGRRLCKFIKERGWSILNGNIRGDEEGEWTYTGGRGNSVIDYVLGDERTREGIRKVVIEEKVDSDHHPLTVWLEGSEKQRKGEEKRNSGRGGVRIWTKEIRERFRAEFGERGEAEEEVEKEWEKLKGRIGESLEKIEEKDKEEGKRGWWNKECREEKKRVRSELRRWRKEGGGGEGYRKEKLIYKRMCEEKKRREVER